MTGRRKILIILILVLGVYVFYQNHQQSKPDEYSNTNKKNFNSIFDRLKKHRNNLETTYKNAHSKNDLGVWTKDAQRLKSRLNQILQTTNEPLDYEPNDQSKKTRNDAVQTAMSYATVLSILQKKMEHNVQTNLGSSKNFEEEFPDISTKLTSLEENMENL